MTSFTRRTRFRRWLALGGAALLLAIGLALGSLYANVTVPVALNEQEQSASLPQATLVYSADGEELARFYREHRQWVDIDDIAPAVIDALIAVEDRRFWTHRGVDARRLLGAAWHTLRGRRQGGSTLTMQLVRNLDEEVAQAPSWQRKVLEIVTALKLERRYEKPELLAFYLNTVPFGAHAHGIEAAAKTYFGTTAADVDTVQAATLVALLKGPSRYNPLRHPERALQRRNLVLRQMAEQGTLSPSALTVLQDAPLDLRDRHTEAAASALAPHFVEHIRSELHHWAEEHGIDPYTAGLRVHTTLDADLQRRAERAVTEQTNALQAVAATEWSHATMPVQAEETETYTGWLERQDTPGFGHLWNAHPELETYHIRRTPRFRELARATSDEEALRTLRADGAFLDSLRATVARLEAGLVALDPGNGAVRAWVGGRHFAADQYDKVALARRQPGSTFKPFVFAAALEHGLSPYDLVRDSVISYPTGDRRRLWRPQNAHGTATNELITLREALAYSLNTVTARLGAEVGAGHIAHLARQAGIRSPLQEVPSLSLGTSDLTLLELTGAYATLASNGRRHPPHVISRIEDASGRLLERFAPEGSQTLSPHTAHLTIDMLRDVTTYGTGASLRTRYGLEGDLAGKTGTSQYGSDGWFVLAHPELVTGVWVGFNDPRVRFRSRHWSQAAHNALPVAAEFFADVLRRYPGWQSSRFRAPAGHHVPPPRFLAESDPLDPAPRVRPALDEPAPQDTSALHRFAYLPMPEDLRQRLLPHLAVHPKEDAPEYEDPEHMLRQALDRQLFVLGDDNDRFREYELPLAPGLSPRSSGDSSESDAERLLRSRLPGSPPSRDH